MKKVLVLLAVVFSITLFAQQNDHLIKIQVPESLNIKDRIILVNASSCAILRAVVVYADTPSFEVIGTCNIVVQGADVTIASFDRNGLKKLRGRTIGIKVKGAKKMVTDSSQMSFGGGGTGGFVAGAVSHSELKAEEINNLSSEDITYDFSVTLQEQHHDLYIIINDNSSEAGVLDF